MFLFFYFPFAFVDFSGGFFTAQLDLCLFQLPIHSTFCIQVTFATFTLHKLLVVPPLPPCSLYVLHNPSALLPQGTKEKINFHHSFCFHHSNLAQTERYPWSWMSTKVSPWTAFSLMAGGSGKNSFPWGGSQHLYLMSQPREFPWGHHSLSGSSNQSTGWGSNDWMLLCI